MGEVVQFPAGGGGVKDGRSNVILRIIPLDSRLGPIHYENEDDLKWFGVAWIECKVIRRSAAEENGMLIIPKRTDLLGAFNSIEWANFGIEMFSKEMAIPIPEKPPEYFAESKLLTEIINAYMRKYHDGDK